MRRMNHRLLGTMGLLTSPLLFIEGALSRFDTIKPNRLNAMLGLFFVIGWACDAIALRGLRATGRGRAGWILLLVQLIGLSLAALQQVQDFIYTTEPPQTLFYRICDAAWPLSVLFMLVVGAFALAARVLERWRRWTPLLCGLSLPLLFAVAAVIGERPAILLFGLYTFAAWAMLGAAVRSGAARRTEG